MAEIDDVIDAQRKRLKRREREAVRDLVNAYIEVERRLMDEVNKLVAELADDPDPTIGKLFRARRTDALLRQVREEIRDYATNTVGPTVVKHRRLAAEQGITDAEQLTLAGMDDSPINTDAVFDRLPTETINTISGMTVDGPLADLLATFGDEAAMKMRSTLITGVALGHNPYKIARELKRTMGISLTRANLIARTEVNRAHRETSRASYRQNNHIVTGWVWHSACDDRTCAVCWAMHGTEFDLDTPMVAHPACRCAMIPKTKTWKELGFTSDIPETSFSSPSGTDLFRQASPDTQRAVLGPRAYEAYRNGEVDLTDFVKPTTSPRFGTTYTRGSLTYAKMRHGQ